MPFAELKSNVKIHYSLTGKGVDEGTVKVRFVDDSAALLMACQAEGYEGETLKLASNGKDAKVVNASMTAQGASGGVRGRLSVNRPTLSYSYRGSGQSSIPRSLDEYSIDNYREDTRQLAEHVGFNRFALVGYSHGGYFATDYALNYPNQVSALVLVEPALFVDRAKLQDRIKLARQGNGEGAIHLLMKQMAPEMALNSKEYNALVKDIKKNYPDPIGLAGDWYARATHEIAEKELGQLRVPTLIIGGERSWVRENIARAARFIPGAELVWLDGTHNLWEEKPTEIAEAIDAFISARKSSPPMG
ncbi:MAG: alpha/beta hydrolase [Pyrinomonadaceae bacterium]